MHDIRDEEKCEVCNGDGIYPIIDRHGKELYGIRCPECDGDGLASPRIISAAQKIWTESSREQQRRDDRVQANLPQRD